MTWKRYSMVLTCFQNVSFFYFVWVELFVDFCLVGAFLSNTILNPNAWNSFVILTGKYWKNGFSHWEMESNNWQFGLKTGKFNGLIWLTLVSERSYWESLSQALVITEMDSVNGKLVLLHWLILNIQHFHGCFFWKLLFFSKRVQAYIYQKKRKKSILCDCTKGISFLIFLREDLRMIREKFQIWQNLLVLTSQMFSVLYLHWIQCLKEVCDRAFG